METVRLLLLLLICLQQCLSCCTLETCLSSKQRWNTDTRFVGFCFVFFALVGSVSALFRHLTNHCNDLTVMMVFSLQSKGRAPVGRCMGLMTQSNLTESFFHYNVLFNGPLMSRYYYNILAVFGTLKNMGYVVYQNQCNEKQGSSIGTAWIHSMWIYSKLRIWINFISWSKRPKCHFWMTFQITVCADL